MTVQVTWTCRSYEVDRNGDTLERPGDVGVLDEETARRHERLGRCEIDQTLDDEADDGGDDIQRDEQ